MTTTKLGWLAVVAMALSTGCGGAAMDGADDSPTVDPAADPDSASLDQSAEALTASGCSTAGVRGLSLQLIAEVNCISPNSFARYTTSHTSLSSAAFPYLQVSAASALAAASRAGGTMQVDSALRTLPQQYLLYHWYLHGQCGITLAARPGTSPHERGLAVDLGNYGSWISTMSRHGWRWHGAGDLVHFDYVGSGARDLSGLSVRAFQRLWNRNNPGDRIAEDGAYGPQTEARLARAPSGGFRYGACPAGRAALDDVIDLDGLPFQSDEAPALDPNTTDVVQSALEQPEADEAASALTDAERDVFASEGFFTPELVH